MLMPPTSNGGARRTYQGARYTALRTYQSARETPQAKAIATWARRSCTHTLPSALCFFHEGKTVPAFLREQMLTPRHATDASSVASLSTSSCHCHTAVAQRAASMEATPTEQQSTHLVPRFDRDIRERPRSTSSGVSFTGAGIAGRRRAQPIGRSEAASHSTALPLTPELATNDGWSAFLGDDEDDPRRSRAGSTSTLLEAPTGRASGRRSHPAEGEPAYHSGALPLSPELAVDNRQNPSVSHAENMQGNRFAGSEFCGECDLPFSDSNYVANTFEGHSYCGDCWDAYLGITIVVASNLHPSTLCGCGRDLHAEPWFTVDLAAQQTPYCRACALSYWGMRGSEFAVTIINDGGNAMGSLHGDDGSYRLQQQVLSTAPLFPGLLHWIILSPEVAHHTHISRQSTAVTTGTLRARRLLHHSPPPF